MMLGTRVVIRRASMECWNGERGRIRSLYTLANGRQAAVIRLANIALEVCFPVDELDTEDSEHAIQETAHSK